MNENKWIAWVVLLTLVVSSCLVLELSGFRRMKFDPTLLSTPDQRISRSNNVCQDPGMTMTQGTWKTRPLTKQEESDIDAFLKHVRTNMPATLQRPDKKCGNVSYSRWFRAICNPKGLTPCCYYGHCVNKSVSECRCPECYDFRSQIHAEYSQWIPSDHKCPMNNYTGKTACGTFKGQIIFVGDSLMRQFFTGFMILMADDDYNKVYSQSLSKDQRIKCSGLYIFGEKACRGVIRTYASFCNNTLRTRLVYRYKISMRGSFHRLVWGKLASKEKNVFVVSVGAHDGFNKAIFTEFMLPALKMIQGREWPKIIWVTNHRFGILKTYRVPYQMNTNVEKFNQFMIENLRKYDVPILDVYNLTTDVMSPDGAHYGKGVNLVKSQMLLNLLQNLKDKHWF